MATFMPQKRGFFFFKKKKKKKILFFFFFFPFSIISLLSLRCGTLFERLRCLLER